MSESYNSFVYDTGADSDGNGQPSQSKLSLCFGMFFDGTKNNMDNIASKEIYDKYKDNEAEIKAIGKNDKKNKEYLAYYTYKKHKDEEDTSYQGDYSNLARLFKACAHQEKYAFYFDGPGTLQYKSDDMFEGLAFGNGDNGVRGKVKSACEKIAGKISEQVTRGKKDITVTFDVFGFSRGAAAARNFVHEVTRRDGIKSDSGDVDDLKYFKKDANVRPNGMLGYYLNKKGLDINQVYLKVVIRYAGLYDTVSSYMPNYSVGTLLSEPEFDDDILRIENINKAKTIVHLTAADEHRLYFALSKTSSVQEKKDGVKHEISLPGEHCDIGGSHSDNMTEQDYLVRMDSDTNVIKNDYEYLIAQGWFRKSDRNLNSKSSELVFTRRNISNKYSYIALHLMARYMKKYDTVFQKNFVLKEGYLNKHYPIPNENSKHDEIMLKVNASRIDNILQFLEKQVAANAKYDWKTDMRDEINVLLSGMLMEESERYSFEPLKFAMKYILPDNLDDIKSLPILIQATDLLRQYTTLADLKKDRQNFDTQLLEQECIRCLRRRFLHWSSFYHDSTSRGINKAYPNQPRLAGGRRIRNIIHK